MNISTIPSSTVNPADPAWQTVRELLAAERFAEAETLCDRIVAADPKHADAWHCLGLLAGRRGDHARAADHIGRAVALNPHQPDFHSNLSRPLRALGRREESAAACRRALALAPDHGDALFNLGSALFDLQQFEEAADALQRVLDLQPDHLQVVINLAIVRFDQGRPEEAIATLRAALARHPAHAPFWINLASFTHHLGRYGESLAAARRAVALDPADAEAHFHLGLYLLLQDDYPAGWPEFEWRWGCEFLRDHPLRRVPPRQPRWEGGDLAGKTILLAVEQGYGDVFQCLRYVPLLAARGARILLYGEPGMLQLLRRLPGVAGFYQDWHRLPPHDVYCPLMSLPRIFGTTIHNLPAPASYLAADPPLVNRWRRAMEPGRLNVGLVWAGRPTHARDADRSVALGTLAPLAAVPGVTFHSLQKGPAAAQARTPPTGMRLLDRAAALENFSGTAGLLANLDLVIGVDTAVIHLAGALGRPTWVLLPFVPDWRWGLNRETSPWYPTLRLFRQERLGEWVPVLARVAGALAERAAAL